MKGRKASSVNASREKVARTATSPSESVPARLLINYRATDRFEDSKGEPATKLEVNELVIRRCILARPYDESAGCFRDVDNFANDIPVSRSATLRRSRSAHRRTLAAERRLGKA